MVKESAMLNAKKTSKTPEGMVIISMAMTVNIYTAIAKSAFLIFILLPFLRHKLGWKRIKFWQGKFNLNGKGAYMKYVTAF